MPGGERWRSPEAPGRSAGAWSALVVVVLAAGAATTGTGPHAGGKGAKRIPIGLEDMTRIHAEVVIVTVVVLLALLWVLWRTNAPGRVQDAGRVLLAVMVVQGIIGYTQFFTRLPAVLVGIHVLGASTVWAAVLWFHHGLSDHLPEAGDGSAAARLHDGGACSRRHRCRAGAGVSKGPLVADPSAVRNRQTEALPVEADLPEFEESKSTDRPWLVIVWNDPINLMSFVTFVFQKLFGYSKEKATKLMLDVHHKGRAVVSSGTRERAELDVYRLHEHGLWATMEQST